MAQNDYVLLYDIFEKLERRCPNMDGELTDYTMEDFIGDKKWSDTPHVDEIVEDQLAVVQANRPLMQKDTRDDFLVMEWILSHQGTTDGFYFSIGEFALNGSYDAFF
ncbi:hypothetical protein AJ80_02531 [Polytolypa hystricis UAMH7299]|uniref:Uncharacterized protein n=1 Tax=Polytolypa hystricis (strain UAMH7299) TaxID=1447883 RepID=A0A2B7YQU7_POLH7|nr:hypothetical protein AJ80_02531 [Polytolypa hystricis UAMH7299]